MIKFERVRGGRVWDQGRGGALFNDGSGDGGSLYGDRQVVVGVIKVKKFDEKCQLHCNVDRKLF